MTGSYIVASDVGSGSCKTIILDLDGRVVSSVSQEYPIYYPQPGWVEQEPDDWYLAFCNTVRRALDQGQVAPEQVIGIGVVGVTHNVVLLDERDRPLCRTILLFDNRSTAQAEAIRARWGDAVRQKTLNEVTTVWTWPQMLWIREHRPEIWRATRRILFQKDYVRHRLAPSPVTDLIDASGTLLFDPVRGAWIEAFCEDLALDPAWLPRVADPLEVVAEVSPQGAADTGLKAGTPVITGTTDTAAEVLGSGAVRPGSAVVKLASVGRIAAVTEEPMTSRHVLNYRHILDGLWYPGTASKSAASSFRWLRDVVWCEADSKAVYDVMDEAAARIRPGCDGLLFHPHLHGEWAPYWDEKMRGSFVGLTAPHTRAHLTRAVLEGVAFSLKDALAEMEDLGLKAKEIRLIGQGSKSALWSQIVANVLDRPLYVPAQPDAAYGTALITAMGLGTLARTPEALDASISMRCSIEPEPEMARAYAELFEIYREADASLRSTYARLHDFENRQVSR